LTFALREGLHFYIVGIGGSGMSAIARLLLGRGFVVSGSDRAATALTAVLHSEGATVYEGHDGDNIAGADVLIISSAIPADNAEVVAARAAGIPILKRADLLGHLMDGYTGIAIAGTHGKTTTTGMITQIFMQAGLDPTVVVGSDLPLLGGNGRFGTGRHFIIEADEYDNMFLGLRPTIAVITNIEHDHPDIFPTDEAYLAAFLRFANLLPADGTLILCGDDAGAMRLLSQFDRPDVHVVVYGMGDGYDLMGLNGRSNPIGGTDFIVQQKDDLVGLARLRVPGKHNSQNALAAIAAGMAADVCFDDMRTALAQFGGMARRFQIISTANRVAIIDDYAHHPTEIRATLAAAREQYVGRRMWAVWQPHTFSRTELLLNEFAASFDDADRVVVLDVYRSRETEADGVGADAAVAAMTHANAIHVGDRRAAADYITERILPDDVVLTLGAGDGNMVGVWIAADLKNR
jgi:UDP-N-acetylmuramate--alanine ligase